MKPTHYTNREGGKWIRWGKSEFSQRWLYRGGAFTVQMGRRRVHSLSRRKHGKNKWRWDCVNGQTHPNLGFLYSVSWSHKVVNEKFMFNISTA